MVLTFLIFLRRRFHLLSDDSYFRGFATFSRTIIHNFSIIPVPTTDYIPRRKLIGTKAAYQASEETKKKLTKVAVLRLQVFSKLWEVACDTSHIRTSLVDSQEGCPIAISKRSQMKPTKSMSTMIKNYMLWLKNFIITIMISFPTSVMLYITYKALE